MDSVPQAKKDEGLSTRLNLVPSHNNICDLTLLVAENENDKMIIGSNWEEKIW